jgi:hypothetical protein
MKRSKQGKQKPYLAERKLTKVQTVIDFQKEPRVRHKVLDIEDEVKDIFPQPAIVGPVEESQPEEYPRVIFPGPESCSFSQIRMDYVVHVPKERSREVSKVLTETQQKATRLFTVFHQHTGRAITRMGIILHFLFPLPPGEKSVRYLHTTFFKPSFAPAKLTELDFHFAEQSGETYNLNWSMRAVQVPDGKKRDAILVILDINNYREKNRKGIEAFGDEVIARLFSFVRDQVKTKVAALVVNQLTLE